MKSAAFLWLVALACVIALLTSCSGGSYVGPTKLGLNPTPAPGAAGYDPVRHDERADLVESEAAVTRRSFLASLALAVPGAAALVAVLRKQPRWSAKPQTVATHDAGEAVELNCFGSMYQEAMVRHFEQQAMFRRDGALRVERA